MKRFDIRWKNFRSLSDTGWISIKPLTVVIGANATGKTSLLAPLLLMKQTVESSDSHLALKTVGDYFNAGSYENLIFNHDLERKLELNIRFKQPKNEPGPNIPEIGDAPPGTLSITLDYSANHDAPQLKRYLVRDIYGRAMLDRARLKSGRYTVKGVQLQNSGPSLHSLVRASGPEHFLFSSEAVFKQRLAQELDPKRRARRQKESGSDVKVEVTDDEDTYLSAVSYVKNYVERLLKEISYIGPLSQPPMRIYEMSGEKPKSVGIRGEFAPEILYRERNTAVMKKVDAWMSKFDFGSRLKCNTLADGIFNLTLCKGNNSPAVNIADTGFGLSQVLPLVVQSYYSEPRSLMIAEQPEVHLNPRIQALLADVFCDSVNRGNGVMVETHSEHFLLRLRRLIAEKKIEAKNVALYFAEKEGDQSKIRSIPIESNGHIDPTTWPKGFFEDTLKEALGLAAAQASK